MFNSTSSDKLKNLNLPFFKRRPREQFMSANAYSIPSASFILARASFYKSYLRLVKSNWIEISDLCFLALHTFVLWIKPLNLTITCWHSFPSSRPYFFSIRWMRMKSLWSTSTFKMFRMYCFTIFPQFSLNSFCFVWKLLNLKLCLRQYCSRSSNFLAFDHLYCFSKYTIWLFSKQTLSSSLGKVSSFVVAFSSKFTIFNPNSFIVSLCFFISILTNRYLLLMQEISLHHLIYF